MEGGERKSSPVKGEARNDPSKGKRRITPKKKPLSFPIRGKFVPKKATD